MNFKSKVIRSFRKVKNELTDLKDNLGDWITFYNKKHDETELRMRLLELRVSQLEGIKLGGIIRQNERR